MGDLYKVAPAAWAGDEVERCKKPQIIKGKDVPTFGLDDFVHSDAPAFDDERPMTPKTEKTNG